MRKRLLTLSGIGALLGMAMVVLIPAIFNRSADGATRLFSIQLLERVGSPAGAMLVSLLVYGLYGAACMGGSMLYEIERWPMALSTAVHYAIVAIGYALCAKLLCWNMPLRLLLLIVGMMTAGFFLIWLVLYLRFRAQVRELNRMAKEKNNKKTN